MKKIVLISCGKDKRNQRAKAGDMYEQKEPEICAEA